MASIANTSINFFFWGDVSSTVYEQRELSALQFYDTGEDDAACARARPARLTDWLRCICNSETSLYHPPIDRAVAVAFAVIVTFSSFFVLEFIPLCSVPKRTNTPVYVCMYVFGK